jgi:creatinine amidohydrolase
MSTSIFDLTSPDVDAVLARSRSVVVPFGSIEQHGPHLPCGTDTMAAELIAKSLAVRLDALFVPFCPYGITPIHSGYPGTISLRRKTFENLLIDVCEELVAMGAATFVMVNWHEGNTASLNAVATDLQAKRDVRFYVAQACYVAQRIYEDRGGTLTHGGGIETLAVMAHDARLVKIDRTEGGEGDAGVRKADTIRRGREVYGFVTNIRDVTEKGWYGDPSWATEELANDFESSVVDEIVAQLEQLVPQEGSR